MRDKADKPATDKQRAETAEMLLDSSQGALRDVLREHTELRDQYNTLRAAVEKEADKLYAKGHYSSAINLRKLLNDVEDGEQK